jgi:anti-sigma B factor antagonist
MKNYYFTPHNGIMHLHLTHLQGVAHYNEIQVEIDQYIAKSVTEFALDLSELKYIDSVGLSLLITILTKARNAGGDVSLLNPSLKVEKMLMVTKLQHLFKPSNVPLTPSI